MKKIPFIFICFIAAFSFFAADAFAKNTGKSVIKTGSTEGKKEGI